jgi:hypothetical protein
MAWTMQTTIPSDRERILGPSGGDRVHAVAYRWLEAMPTLSPSRIGSPPISSRPFGGPAPHATVATRPVEPLGPPEQVPDLFELHQPAGKATPLAARPASPPGSGSQPAYRPAETPGLS